MEDEYWPEPRAAYDERQRLYLEYCASQTPGGRTGFLSQIARLELGREPVAMAPMREAIDFVYTNRDCSDFTVAGLLRVLHGYRNSPDLGPALLGDIEACLLKFKYWWDEPGDDRRCYHTENHQIIFHSDELLAGQLYRDRIFENSGKSGRYHIQHAEHLIRRWMDFRMRFGFSEWLSNCYFEEDLIALANLHDFAEAPDIQRRAGLLIDILLFEMALHSYRGVFGCTHGRTYAGLIKGAQRDASATTGKLMLGMGLYNAPATLGAVPLATSAYRCPPTFERIAADLAGPRRMRERHSINIADAPEHGLSYDSEEDGHLYWSIQDYLHPNVIELSRRLSEKYGVRLHEDYEKRYSELFQSQIDTHGRIVDPDVDCHALTEVHVETYRTSGYLLSCAQDYRPGKPGYQQHIWQATLGLNAVAFTNHPGSADQRSRPNYWAGNGVMPRAAQHEDVLICIHHVPASDAYPFSHAYFPCGAFDEVEERDGWVCARKSGGYIGLHASQPTRWMEHEGEGRVELRADAEDVVWVCQMGTQPEYADLRAFVVAVTSSRIHSDGLGVTFESPSQGTVAFGWDRPFELAGRPVRLHDSARFDNPYCLSAFSDPQIVITHEGGTVHLDFERNTRTIRDPAGSTD